MLEKSNLKSYMVASILQAKQKVNNDKGGEVLS